MLTPGLVLFRAAISIAWALAGQNPGWPASDPALGSSALSRPENMPGDPDFAPRSDPETGCAGQLALYGFTPACVSALNLLEQPLGTGVAADRAWLLTTGAAVITLAVLDRGVRWDDVELVSRWRLNPAEVPAPIIEGRERDHDTNGDGVVTILDYTTATGTTPPSLERVADERLLARTDRGDANRNGLLDPQDLLLIFSNGLDDDDNGYTDDLAGWDFVDDDPDAEAPAEAALDAARIAAAEANNGLGGAGVCPRCTILATRVASGSIARGEQLAQAIIFSATQGAKVIAAVVPPSYGTGFLDAAVRLAEQRDAVTIAAPGSGGGVEVSGPWSRALITTGLTADRTDLRQATTLFAPDRCESGSLRATVSAPSIGGAPGAVAIAAGVAGLAFSAAEGIKRQNVAPLEPQLGAVELRQLLASAAQRAPAQSGWSALFGRGRLDARAAVDAVIRRAIPPPVLLLQPSWSSAIDPTDGEPIQVRGEVMNSRHDEVSWVLEYAIGGEPAPDAFSPISSGSVPRDTRAVVTGEIPAVGLFRDPAAEPEEPLSFAVTLRLTATARAGSAVASSETRRVVFVHHDLRSVPGFPVDLRGTIAGAPRVMDLDGDGRDEILVATTEGALHLIDGLGRAVPGWPVRTPVLPELDPARPDHGSAPAYSSGALGFEPILQPITAAPAIGNLERERLPERSIVAVTVSGTVLALDLQGNLQSGFPVILSSSVAMPHGPALADLDADGKTEIVVADSAGKVWVLGSGGTLRAGFPIELGEPVSAPAIGDLDGDGRLDLVLAGHRKGFAIDVTGRALEGWPIELEALPSEPPGLPSPPVITRLDPDEEPAVLIAPWGRRSIAVRSGAQIEPAAQTGRDAFGARSLVELQGPPVFPIGGEVAALELDGDGRIDLAFRAGVTGCNPAVDRGPLAGVWSVEDGASLPGFPLALSRFDPSGFAAVDLDGDRRVELIFADGHQRLRATSANGISPEGWPKLVTGALAGAPALGDLLGDRHYEVVAASELGLVWAWRTRGPTSGSIWWEGARHDLAATGNTLTPTTDRAIISVDEGCDCSTTDRSSALPWLAGLLLWAVRKKCK